MLSFGLRLLVGSFLLVGFLSGRAQSLDQYGWALEQPFFSTQIVSGPDGAVYFGGDKDEFRFRGDHYPSATGVDIVVLRISPSGGLDWVRRFGGAGNDRLGFLAIDESGRLVVSGNENRVGDRQWVVDPAGQVVETIDGAGSSNRALLPGGNGFVEWSFSSGIGGSSFRVLDSQGEFVWARKIGPNVRVLAVRGLADNTFLAVGYSLGELGQIGKNGRIPDGDEEWEEVRGPFIARFGAEGELLWAKSAEDRVSVTTGVANIDENGNAIFGGTFRNVLRLGSQRFETGGGEGSFLSNAFIVSWDSGGNVKWIKHIASDAGSNVSSIALSPGGTVYVGGEFDDAASFEGQNLVEDPIDEFQWAGAYVLGLQPNGTSLSFNGLAVGDPMILAPTSGELYLQGLFDGERQLGIWPVGAAGRRNVGFVARLGNLGPMIAEHPKSLMITDADRPVFEVLVTGTAPVELQWRKDGVPLEESDRFTGVKESTLRALQAGRDNLGSYDVVATSGSTSVTSQAATVRFENGAPVFTSGSRVDLEFNQVGEELIHRVPLAVEDPDGDQALSWTVNVNPRFRTNADPIEVSLRSTTGLSNELIIRWPPPEGRRFTRRNYIGTVTVTDPAGAAAELPVQAVFDPLDPTALRRTRMIAVEEDSTEMVFVQQAHDDNLDPSRVNPETLEWRVSVLPESLGQATVTVIERPPFHDEPDLSIAFTPAPDAHGEGEVILEALGSLTPDPISFSIPASVRPVNDAPRLLSSVSIQGEVAVGATVRADIGQWFDPETELLGLSYELQWLVNDSPAVEGAQGVPGATTENLLLSNELLDRFIGLRVSVSDERETTVAYSEFLQVTEVAAVIPDFSQLPETAISGGYRIGGWPEAFGNDWIREGRRMINLRDPELSFDINDRVTPPFRSVDRNRDWLGFFPFKNNPNWIGMHGSATQTWVFDVDTILGATQRISANEALFTYFTGQGSDRFTDDFLGIFVTPEREFLRLSESNVTNTDALYLATRDGTRITTLGNGRVSDLVGTRAQFRANPNTSHVLFVHRIGELSVREFPSLELVSETVLASNLTIETSSAEWGLSEDGTRALVRAEGVAGQKRMLLVDTETGTLVREFRLDAANDFIVSLPSVARDQAFAKGPLTVPIAGEAAFVIERNIESEDAASLDFVSWSSGVVLRTDWIEKGMFHTGDYYHPERPGQFLYASALSASLLVHDFASGEVVERLPVPDQLLREGTDRFTHVRISPDGRLMFLSNQRGHTVAFHPLASGEVRGVVFDDRNGNGQLDFELIQSETPHIVYVIDVSGSVEEQFVGTAVGDVNLDERANTILDAELAAFSSFHRNLIRFGQADDARVAVVGFSGEARAFGLDGVVAPSDAMMEGKGDADSDLVPDVLQALRRVRLSTSGLGGGTDFFTGLALARDIFGAAGTAPEQANIIFLSDGEASNNFQELADELKGLGVNIRAIGVGRDSSLTTLRRMDPSAIQVTSSDELIAAFEPEEDLLPNVSVYVDFDASGHLNDDEASTTSLSDNAFTTVIEAGDYSFRPLSSGSYPIRADIPEYEVTSNPVAQVQPVVPTIHLIAMRSIHQVDPPSIAIQPLGGEWEVGQTVRLSVFAVGSGLRFQWLKNGSAIAGETSSSLTLDSVQVGNAGDYSVTIVNDGGRLDSAVATIAVRVPPRVIPLGEAMDAPEFTWRTGGAVEWRGTDVESFVNGSSAGVSGVGDGQEAWIETDVSGPGTVEFYWKVSSEAGQDFLRFERTGGGGRTSTQISGDSDWRKSGKIELAAGLNTLRWIYRKNDSNAVGQDAAWVDALLFERGEGVPPSVEFLPGLFVDPGDDIFFRPRYTAGTLPVTFRWQFNGEDINRVGNSSQLGIPDATQSHAGEYRFIVSNEFGSATSNVARVVVRDPAVNPAIVPVTNDVWDVSQGIVITEHTEVEANSDIRDIFGGAFGSHTDPERVGSVDFERRQRGEQQVIYWRTPEPVTVGRVRLFADGGNDADRTRREFLAMSIRAKTVGSENFNAALGEINPSHPYEYLDEGLILDRKLNNPVTAQEFFVFFNQGDLGSRIIELDAFSPVAIVTQPESVSIDEGGNVRFSVNVAGSGPFSYQWYFGELELSGETGSELLLQSVRMAASGQYRVEVSNVVGSVSSEMASLNVIPAVDPASIVVHPRGVTLNAGESAALFVVAGGGEPLSYQWRKNGVSIPSATRDQLLLQGVGLDDAGDYDVVVSNPGGQVISEVASVVVNPASVPPPIVPPVPGEGPTEVGFDLNSMGVVFNDARSNQSSFNARRPGRVAVEGEWAFFGDTTGGPLICDGCTNGRGEVLVFRRTGNEWVQTQILREPINPSLGPLAYQQFGDRIELAQGTLAVGTNGGALYSFRLSGDQWVLGQSYLENVGRTSGIAMDQAGTRLVVGPAPSGSFVGPNGSTVFIGFTPSFQRSTSDADWEFESYLVQHTESDPDPTYVAFGNNGYAGDDDMEMAPSGNFLAASLNAGVAFFRATAPGRWQFVERLETPDEGQGIFPDVTFGRNLALSDSYLAVGAPGLNQTVRGERQGAVFVYRIDSGTPQLVQTLKQPDLPGLPALDTKGTFGNAVAMNDRYMVIGNWDASTDTSVPSNQGLVCLYERVVDRWKFRESMTAARILGAIAPRFAEEVELPWAPVLDNFSTNLDIHGNSLIISGKLHLGRSARLMAFIFSLAGGDNLPPLPPTAIPAPTLRWDRDAGGLVLEGRAGVGYVIEATSDPASDSWVPVTTLTLETDEGTWVDPVSGFIPFRFYRARLVP